MDATIIARTPISFTLQVEVPCSDSMLGFEETLQQWLYKAGVVAIAEGLQQFDTDGSPSNVGLAWIPTEPHPPKDSALRRPFLRRLCGIDLAGFLTYR